MCTLRVLVPFTQYTPLHEKDEAYIAEYALMNACTTALGKKYMSLIPHCLKNTRNLPNKHRSPYADLERLNTPFKKMALSRVYSSTPTAAFRTNTEVPMQIWSV